MKLKDILSESFKKLNESTWGDEPADVSNDQVVSYVAAIHKSFSDYKDLMEMAQRQLEKHQDPTKRKEAVVFVLKKIEEFQSKLERLKLSLRSQI